MLLRLAHACSVPAEVAAAWQHHFADYEVTPLFEQFGKPAFVLPAERRKETELRDLEGHLVKAFRLAS